jgi:hypothetical protein
VRPYRFCGEVTVPIFQRLSAVIVLGASVAASAAAQTPAYTPDGRLKFPDNYREWIFLSAGLDMSYREDAMSAHHSGRP